MPTHTRYCTPVATALTRQKRARNIHPAKRGYPPSGVTVRKVAELVLSQHSRRIVSAYRRMEAATRVHVHEPLASVRARLQCSPTTTTTTNTHHPTSWADQRASHSDRSPRSSQQLHTSAQPRVVRWFAAGGLLQDSIYVICTMHCTTQHESALHRHALARRLQPACCPHRSFASDAAYTGFAYTVGHQDGALPR
jgi:hypothetical protein